VLANSTLKDRAKLARSAPHLVALLAVNVIAFLPPFCDAAHSSLGVENPCLTESPESPKILRNQSLWACDRRHIRMCSVFSIVADLR